MKERLATIFNTFSHCALIGDVPIHFSCVCVCVCVCVCEHVFPCVCMPCLISRHVLDMRVQQ